MSWDTRLAWASEYPADQAVSVLRLESQSGTGADRTTPADAGVDGTIVKWTAASAALNAGNRGNRLLCNANAPATEQTSVRVPYFEGLWPSSGKLLLSIWAGLRYAMTFSPLMSTRNTSGKAPLAYLSTMSDGRPRAMVYDASGALILDQSETLPWSAAANVWTCYMMLLDLDAKTSQIACVRHSAQDKFVGPVRSFSGTPNAACEADLHALTLSPTAAYWSNGYFDEIVVAHPGATFDLEDWAEQVRLSLHANGRDSANPGLSVSDTGVAATTSAVLSTGAEEHSWLATPAVEPRVAISGTPLALLSTDGGITWTEPSAELPETFDGLVRWQVPLEQGEIFRGLDLIEAQPVPVLDPVPDIEITQHDAIEITLTGSWIGTPTIQAISDSGIQVGVDATKLTITSSLSAGDFTITASVADDTGQTSEPISIRVSVTVLPWDPPENPVFPRAPIIVHNAAGQREAIIADASSAVLTREVNGEQSVTFAVPAAHRHAAHLIAERGVEVVDDLYRIRRLTDYRYDGVAMVDIRRGPVVRPAHRRPSPCPRLQRCHRGPGLGVRPRRHRMERRRDHRDHPPDMGDGEPDHTGRAACDRRCPWRGPGLQQPRQDGEPAHVLRAGSGRRVLPGTGALRSQTGRGHHAAADPDRAAQRGGCGHRGRQRRISIPGGLLLHLRDPARRLQLRERHLAADDARHDRGRDREAGRARGVLRGHRR